MQVRTKTHLAKGGYRYIYIVYNIEPWISVRVKLNSLGLGVGSSP